jgi:hypothetical protein
MWEYKLVLDSGEELYYDNLDDARMDRLEFGGEIYDKNKRHIL